MRVCLRYGLAHALLRYVDYANMPLRCFAASSYAAFDADMLPPCRHTACLLSGDARRHFRRRCRLLLSYDHHSACFATILRHAAAYAMPLASFFFHAADAATPAMIHVAADDAASRVGTCRCRYDTEFFALYADAALSLPCACRQRCYAIADAAAVVLPDAAARLCC